MRGLLSVLLMLIITAVIIIIANAVAFLGGLLITLL